MPTVIEQFAEVARLIRLGQLTIAESFFLDVVRNTSPEHLLNHLPNCLEIVGLFFIPRQRAMVKEALENKLPVDWKRTEEQLRRQPTNVEGLLRVVRHKQKVVKARKRLPPTQLQTGSAHCSHGKIAKKTKEGKKHKQQTPASQESIAFPMRMGIPPIRPITPTISPCQNNPDIDWWRKTGG